MKVIDLLNKIANDEVKNNIEFVYNNELYIYYKDMKLIKNQKRKNYKSFHGTELNNEVKLKPEFQIDNNGYIHTNSGAWKGRKIDIEFAKALNYLLEKK